MKGELENSMFLIVVLVIGLSTCVTNADLVAHWKLDEMGGNTASDIAGNDNTGMLKNGPVWQPSGGRFDGALEFDGVDDYVQTADDLDELQLTGDNTLAVWIKVNANQEDWAGIISKCTPDGLTNHWTLQFDDSFHKRLILNYPAATWDTGITLNEVAGNWHHLIVVCRENTMTSYLDANEVNSNTWNNNPGSGDGHLNIGAERTPSTKQVYRGLIDDITIFDHALSETEVAQLYRLGGASFISDPAMQTLISIVQKAKAIFEKQGPQETIAFLEKRIAECEQWRQKNPNDVRLPYEQLSYDLYFLLAEAKEAANFPKEDIVAAYKRAIFSFKKGGLGKSALIWLFENVPTEDYIAFVRKFVHNSNVVPRSIYYIAEHFESNGNWTAFTLFLDAVFSEVNTIVPYAKAIAEGLRENGVWAKKFWKYCQNKPELTEYVYEKLARENIKKGKFLKAAEIYRDLVNQCGLGQDRAIYEFKVCECIFHGGQYSSAVPELDGFIKNKAAHRALRRKAILMKGQAYIQLGEIDKASDTFLSFSMEYPEAKEAPEANFFIGYCHMLKKEFEQVIDIFNVVVQKYPKSSYASKASMCLTRIKNMTE